MRSVICSEVIVKSKILGKRLYLVTIDMQKAFNVVNHVIVKKNIYEESIEIDLWNIVDQFYSNSVLKSEVAGWPQ